MTSRQFLNAAHAALVEEFMRPLGSGGPIRSLMDALEMAAPWAEGYVPVEELEDGVPASGNSRQAATKREPTEEEIVAQNNRTLAWLEGRMSSVKGGFRTTAPAT